MSKAVDIFSGILFVRTRHYDDVKKVVVLQGNKPERRFFEERPQGEWIIIDDTEQFIAKCSVCGMRLGDLDALKEEIVKLCTHINANNGITVPTLAFTRIIDNAPTVEVPNYAMGYQDGVRKVLKEVAEGKHRPQGKWIDYNAYYKTCPFCKRTVGIDFLIQSYENPIKTYNFCPNCGADMRKGGAE